MAHRVFLGLNEVAGYFTGLEKGLVELGIDARFWDLSEDRYGYRSRRSKHASDSHGGDSPGSPRGRVRHVAAGVGRRLRAAFLLPWALARFDTFVIAAGMGFVYERELPIMRAFGKRVIVIFLGSDHRPPYLNGLWIRGANSDNYRRIIRDSRRLRARVRRAERWAHAIVALPASAQFHSLPYFDFLQVGFPAAIPADETLVSGGLSGHPLRVLHCPTRPEAKGSPLIRAAIAHLQDRGIPLEYLELSGVPHEEVLSAIAKSDFVVDEVYSDTPMAGFSAEAAHFGRPAVVCGYYARELPGSRPIQAIPPTLFCEPHDLTSAIEKMATDHEFRIDLGRRAQDFVQSWWSPKAVASRILRIAEGTAQEEWLVDPTQGTYVGGWGIDESALRKALRELVTVHGTGVLQLDGLDAAKREVLRQVGSD